jgi:putative transcriptional regulator
MKKPGLCDIFKTTNMMTNISDMSAKLLIAAPGLEDPNFKQTVVLVCEHSKQGAFGLIVNRVLMNSFKPLMKAFEIEKSVIDLPIFYGGPVRPDQGYVIYSPYDEKYGAIKVADTLAVTASKEVLYDIARGKGPAHFLFTLGFAGWSPAQLEEEVMMDAWLVSPLDRAVIFSLPVANRWRHAASSIGVDFERFICKSGRA